MNDLERFLAIVNFEKPDYVPIFGFPGAPGMSRGCMKITHDQLVATGMPEHVGKLSQVNGKWKGDVESWYRYWGTTGPSTVGFSLASGAEGFQETRRIEDGYEIVESENGAITRQVINNDITYSMPEYVQYPVRDRESWGFYKERLSPRERMSREEMIERCKIFENRDKPLEVKGGGTYGSIRSLFGPEGVSFMFYDDPGLLHEIIDWRLEQIKEYTFPIIEHVKPEIIHFGEDLCYNHGMLLSPEHFEEFCAPYYREVCAFAKAQGVALCAIDTDGDAMEFTAIAKDCGVDAIFPYEVKAGNDLFALREQHPDFKMFGWLEKEVVNDGNEDQIEEEIMSKVPALLEKGGYFPNGDHGIQPLVTYEGLRKFMTLLHEVCGNPEGEFLRE